MTKQNEQELADFIINRFRDLVGERYKMENLVQYSDQVNQFDPSWVNQLRYFFLEYIFPAEEDRHRLEKAFASLTHYLSSPGKMLPLTGDLFKAVFKFGRLFGKAMKVAFNGLRAYQKARDFQETLVAEARSQKVSLPLSDERYFELLRTVPEKKARKFIQNLQTLLEAFVNDELISKGYEILNHVHQKMKERPGTYPATDVEAIEMGLKIIEEGRKLFQGIDEEKRQLLVEAIIEVEEANLDRLYQKFQQ